MRSRIDYHQLGSLLWRAAPDHSCTEVLERARVGCSRRQFGTLDAALQVAGQLAAA